MVLTFSLALLNYASEGCQGAKEKRQSLNYEAHCFTIPGYNIM